MQYELREIAGFPYYGFGALDDAGIAAGFMTRPSEALLTDAARKSAFKAALSAEDMVVLNQVHGADVHVIAAGERPAAGDGLVLFEPGVAGVIKTADCLPVILYALEGGACAIVHAGWRGTAAHIAGRAVAAMAARGIAPGRIGAIMGPGIGRCCYNIGSDVAAAFRGAGFGGDVFEERGGATFLDLRRANRDTLVREGVGRIDDVDICTSCTRDLFFSARRDNGRPGRQVNFAMVKETGR
jgi:hypothetical protein